MYKVTAIFTQAVTKGTAKLRHVFLVDAGHEEAAKLLIYERFSKVSIESVVDVGPVMEVER
jgi:hypothetical protein